MRTVSNRLSLRGASFTLRAKTAPLRNKPRLLPTGARQDSNRLSLRGASFTLRVKTAPLRGR
jgi:hypothetical protein